MNINGLNTAASSGALKSLSTAYVSIPLASPTNTTANVEPESDTQSSVNISNAGRQALENDLSATLRSAFADKLQQSQSKETEEKPTSIIDEQIKRIKEQIKDLQEKLTKLKGDNSEAAAQQRKLLQDQIMQLSGQITTLMEQKVREAKKSAG